MNQHPPSYQDGAQPIELRRDIYQAEEIQPQLNSILIYILAESEGFEPSEPYRLNALAVRRFKPLTQLSKSH